MKIKIDKSKEFLKKLPKSAGVYLFYDKKGELVYVGRAANLKTRVSSYFANSVGYPISHKRPARHARQLAGVAGRPIETLINEVAAMSFEKTNTLLDAAVLEANFIKGLMPRYNVKDKDNKSFVYLFFDMKADFPKPVIIRGRDLGKFRSGQAKILGPYQSLHVIKNILFVARRIYPYSTCKPFDGTQGKPCFHRQIGLCPGACSGEIVSMDYKKGIRRLMRYLESRHPTTKYGSVNDVALMPGNNLHVSGVSKAGLYRVEAYDISHFQKGDAYGSMVVFENHRPQKSLYRLFKIKNAKKGSDTGALSEVLIRRLKHAEWNLPNLIVVDGGRQQLNSALRAMKQSSANIPVIGIAKAGKHAASSSSDDKLIFPAAFKRSAREFLGAQKNLIQRARNEAHRFAIKQIRKNQKIK